MESTKEIEKNLSPLLSLPITQTNKKNIHNLITDLNDSFILLISGEFKAGKSTFINALIGEEIVKSDISPATAVITKFIYGDERKFTVHFKNGTYSRIEENLLHRYTAEDSDFAEIRSAVAMVEIQLPLELLRHLTIVDTPGLGSVYEHHTAVTESYIDRADGVIWIFNYTDTGLGTEMETISDIRKRNLEPILVVNKIDSEDEEEEDLEDILEDNRRRIRAERLYGVSAKMALEGKLAGDEETLLDSNWAVIDTVMGDLILNRRAIKQKRLREKTLQAIQKLVDYYQTLQQDIPTEKDMKATIVALDKLHTYDKELAEIMYELFEKQRQWDLESAITVDDKLNILQDLNILVPNQSKDDVSVKEAYKNIMGEVQAITEELSVLKDVHLHLEEEFHSLSNRMLIAQVPLIWKFPRFEKEIATYHSRYEFLESKLDKITKNKNQLAERLQALLLLSNEKVQLLNKTDIAHAKSKAQVYNRTLDELNQLVSENEIEAYHMYYIGVKTVERTILQLLEMDIFQSTNKYLFALLEIISTLKVTDYPELGVSLTQVKQQQRANEELTLSIRNNPEVITELLQIQEPSRPEKFSFLLDDLKFRRKWIKRGLAGVLFAALLVPGIVDVAQQQGSQSGSNTEETTVEHTASSQEDPPAYLEEDYSDASAAAVETEPQTLLSYYDQTDMAMLIDAIRNNEEVFNYRGASQAFIVDLSPEEAALLNTYNIDVPLEVIESDEFSFDEADADSLDVFVTDHVSSGDTYYHTYHFVREKGYEQPPILRLVSYKQEADIAEIPKQELNGFIEEFHQQITAAYDSGNSTALSPYLANNIFPEDIISTYTNEASSSVLQPVSFAVDQVEAVEDGYQIKTHENYQYETETSSVLEKRSVRYELVTYGDSFAITNVTVVDTSREEEEAQSVINEKKVAGFTMEYYQQFNKAYNDQQFEGVSPYLYEGSSYYDHMRSNIHADRLFGTTFENRLIQMKEYRVVDEWTIEAKMYAENIYTYAEGDVQFKAFDFKLLLHMDAEGKLSIEDSKDAIIIEDYAMEE